jgi:5-methyltetrahydropteroyltriglutamate--homocysteine methyltransferase
MEFQIPFSVTDRITALSCPAIEEFRYARSRTSLPLKVTLPSPMMILGFWSEHSKRAYPEPFELAVDAAHAVQTWLRELAEAGCKYIQVDAPELCQAYADQSVRDDHARRGVDPVRFLELGAELVGGLPDLDLPDDVTIGMHLCKGNGTQSWIADGGYAAFAEKVFSSACNYDVFHFEFDDERSGGFEPLAKLADDKVAVLGLVSTKWTRLEDPAELERRIDEASRFHPKERLALATQCGFASASETTEQRLITEQTQLDKLRLVADVAHRMWR